ncbi:MAG: hypothetical protein Q7S33_01525 [Nanoarchaeota archaeon]|nr:hypothetical protein [Nanoarchaeota archaeon]
MIEKKAQYNFVLIFAIIAGAAILFLAIYGAVKLGNSQQYQINTETAKKIAILTDPLQAGFTTGKYSKISFSQELRINNFCDFSNDFGKNLISVSTSPNSGKKWVEQGGEISVYNKYIFSNSTNQGKNFFSFSKPFEFPYKVADMIFLTSEKYCFVKPFIGIDNELSSLNMENIEVKQDKSECSKNYIQVCFNENCDISVFGTEEEGYVAKENENLNYIGSLVYGAIFSDKENYECNVKRLLYRTGKIAEVYSEKADIFNKKICNNLMADKLNLFSDTTINSNLEQLSSINELSKDLYEGNRAGCEIW